MDTYTLLITGPPGAGKGTQAKVLASQYGWYAFSIGQILRDTADPAIRKIMNAGDLLPTEHVTRLVMEEIDTSSHPVAVDGFPRRLDQAREFESLARANPSLDYVVVLITIDEDVSWQRVMDRERADDTYEVWQHRWQEYYDHTVPAAEYCRQLGKLHHVDGNRSVEEVTRAVENVFHAT